MVMDLNSLTTQDPPLLNTHEFSLSIFVIFLLNFCDTLFFLLYFPKS